MRRFHMEHASRSGKPSLFEFLRHALATHTSASLALPWWHSHAAGYVASPLLVGILTLARFFVTEPLFVWAPFCLIVVIAGFLWGVGPALLTMTLALLAISYVVIPQYELLTLNVWNDIRLLGPFVLVQILIILLAAQNAVRYRRLLAAKQEIHSYAQSLAATNRQLEHTKRLEDYFFMRAAHELRTPLTTILGEAQFALRRLRKAEQSGTDTAVWRTHFENIEGRAHGLHDLVEDLITLYSVRAEETPLQLASCDLRELCRDVIEEQRMLSGRPIALALPAEPALIQADYERLRQVLVNLVDNALKYTPEGAAIQVCIGVEATGAILAVHNEDAALSPEQQARVFEPFYRTPAAEASFKEGWGLGLTISKEYVERHHGRIWVESAEQKGVTFFVALPSQGVV